MSINSLPWIKGKTHTDHSQFNSETLRVRSNGSVLFYGTCQG